MDETDFGFLTMVAGVSHGLLHLARVSEIQIFSTASFLLMYKAWYSIRVNRATIAGGKRVACFDVLVPRRERVKGARGLGEVTLAIRKKHKHLFVYAER